MLFFRRSQGIITNLDFEELAQEVKQDLEDSARAHRQSKKVGTTKPKSVDKYANVICIENMVRAHFKVYSKETYSDIG